MAVLITALPVALTVSVKSSGVGVPSVVSTQTIGLKEQKGVLNIALREV